MTLRHLTRAVATLLAAGVVAVVALLLHDAPSDAQSQKPAGDVSGAATAPEKYAAVERAVTRSDDLSGWRVQDVPEIGLRRASARVLRRSSTKVVAAAPATNAPCLITKHRDGSEDMGCATKPGATTSTITYNGSMGLVPNSVKEVAYEMTDGSVQVAEVVDNLWTSPIEAATVSFRLNGRQEVIHLLPRSQLPEGATINDNGVVFLGPPPEGFDK